MASAWEGAKSWDGPIDKKPDPPPKLEKNGKRVSIDDAIADFIAVRKNRDISLGTLKKYRTFTNQLQAYAASRGYIMLDQLDVSDMDRFYASWKDDKRSRAKKLERLKSFIKFCLKRKWLGEDIAEDLRTPEGSSIPPNKAPFTDEELDRIYKACDEIGGPKPPGRVSSVGRRGCSGFRDAIPLHGAAHFRCLDVQHHRAAQRQRCLSSDA
jgi:integrase